MPTVVQSYSGENRNPRLKMFQVERNILENAAGLCQNIANATAGYHPELSAEAEQLISKLRRLAEIKEVDLTKPW